MLKDYLKNYFKNYHSSSIPAAFIIMVLSGLMVLHTAYAEDKKIYNLTLEKCVELALANNPDLSVSAMESDIKKIDIMLSRSAFLPKIDIGSSYTRYEYDQRIVPPHANNEPGIFDDDIINSGIYLTMPVFRGGKNVAAYKSSRLSSKAAEDNYISARENTIILISNLFYRILETDDKIRSLNASLDALESQKKLTDLNVKVGRRTKLDEMKINVRVASVKQSLSSSMAERKVLLTQLKRAMGEKSIQSALLEISGNLTVKKQALPSLDNAFDYALTKRPEYKAASLEVLIADQGLKIARSDFFPKADIFASQTIRNGLPYDQDNSANNADGNETSWAAGVNISIPLFRGGATRANVLKAEKKIAQAKEKLRSVRLRIKEEIVKAYTAIDDSLQRLMVQQDNVSAAKEALRIERARYKNGKSNINDILDAQAEMLQAETDYSRAAADYILARIYWQRILGNPLEKFIALK